MTDDMPSGAGPTARNYTRKYSALRKGLETTVAQPDFSPEGTRKVIQGGAAAEVSTDLPSDMDSGPQPAINEPSAAIGSVSTMAADEAAPQTVQSGEAATEPRALAQAARTLEDILSRLSANTPDRFTAMSERVALAVRICEAVATMHASGVQLNDLKPTLIAVGLFGEVSLIDRGSATPIGSSGARVTGTPAYMSPEQARGEALTPASDIYALGTICHRLFLLRYPLWDTDPESFWERKRRGVLDDLPDTAVDQVPAPLLAICRHALAPLPQDRYQDAVGMAIDLQRFLDGRSVSVSREGLPRQLVRACNRHRLILAVAAAVIVASVVFLQMRDARRSERERLLQQLAASEAAYSARVADGEAHAAGLRRHLEDIERQRGWHQVVDLDFAKTIDPRLQAVQVNETVRIESDAISLLRQADGVLEILPAPHRNFVRWAEGISEDARIDVEVESPGGKGWNLDVTVAGDPLNGYRLRVYDQDYLCLETINRGWADQLVKVATPPIAHRERLAISLQHLGGRVTVSIDGKTVIDYIDPSPLSGPLHRSVAVGRFFGMFTTRIRRMTVLSRSPGELVGILEPGIAMLRQGQADDARSWFTRVADAPPSPQTAAEARFLAALTEPAGERRRQALLSLARSPGQLLAERAMFVAIDQAIQEELWDELPGLITELRAMGKPDLTRRVALNLQGQMQQRAWLTPVRLRGSLAAFAATGDHDFRVARVGLRDLSALRGLNLEDLLLSDNDIVDAAPLVGPSLQRAQLEGNLLTALPPCSGTAVKQMDISHNPLISIAGLSGSKLERLRLADTPLADVTPLRGMDSLTWLDLTRTQVEDLTPLSGLRLGGLSIGGTPVHDIAPLAGMPLEFLDMSRTRVASLAPLAGGSGRFGLEMGDTAIADLAPLRGRRLTRLGAAGTAVQDLAPLSGMPLESINLGRTKVSDLSPLAGCPLRTVNLKDAPVNDLSALSGAPMTELDLSGHPRGSLQALIGKSFDVLVLPPGPYSAEQLGQFSRLNVRHVQFDPADAEQWAVAEQIPGVVRLNGVLRGAALAAREACLSLLAGKPFTIDRLVEPIQDYRLVLLPIQATRAEAIRLAGLAGGRLPCLGTRERFRQMTSAVYRALPRSDAPVHLGVDLTADGRPVWSDGSPWIDRPLRRADLAQLAAGGTAVFDVNRPYEVLPASTRAVLAVELP